jgi:DNA polymerase-3 subunit delta'
MRLQATRAGKKKASQQITIDQVRALDEFLHVGTHRHGARVDLAQPRRSYESGDGQCDS